MTAPSTKPPREFLDKVKAEAEKKAREHFPRTSEGLDRSIVARIGIEMAMIAYDQASEEIARLKTCERLLSEPLSETTKQEMIRRLESWGYQVISEETIRMTEFHHKDREPQQLVSLTEYAKLSEELEAARARIKELEHEIERQKILLEMADVLITNDNAKEDWENAKRIRTM